MKLTRFKRLATAAAAATLAVSAGAVLVSTPSAFAASPAASGTGVAPATTQANGNPIGPEPSYTIAITASGFDVNAGVVIAECAGTKATIPSDLSTCAGYNSDTSQNFDASGNLTAYHYLVKTVTAAQSGNGTICDLSDPCTLYVGEQLSDPSAPHAFVDFNWTPPPAMFVLGSSNTPQGTLSAAANGGSGSFPVNYGPAFDSSGTQPETVTGNSTVVTPPTHGTVTSTTPGVFKYTSNAGTTSGTTDTFVVGGATVACGPTNCTGGPGTRNTITINVTLTPPITYPASCDVTASPSCVLKQIIVVPVTGADLTMSQSSDGTHPLLDTLGSTLAGTTCTGPALTLNGQPQFACGNLSPITVVNARGSDNAWTLSGQVTDFLDPAASPTLTCDTTGTYNNHCIPGDNMSWGPLASVAHDLVPGDVAAVTPGGAIAPPNVLAAVLQTSGAFNGVKTQAGPVPAPNNGGTAGIGLHDKAETLCTTVSGTSGGTFVCGANIVVAVPASAAAPASPGYEATLTLTLV